MFWSHSHLRVSGGCRWGCFPSCKMEINSSVSHPNIIWFSLFISIKQLNSWIVCTIVSRSATTKELFLSMFPHNRETKVMRFGCAAYPRLLRKSNVCKDQLLLRKEGRTYTIINVSRSDTMIFSTAISKQNTYWNTACVSIICGLRKGKKRKKIK